MPFERLMKQVSSLPPEDQLVTMGELAERWGEPVGRISDAIAAVRVMAGERTYITIDAGPDAGEETA